MNKDNKTNESVELKDETLEQVTGGTMGLFPVPITCSSCGFVNVIHLSDNQYTCAKCGVHHEIMG